MLSQEERIRYLSNLKDEHKVPAVDPVATGVQPIADFLLQHFEAHGTPA